MSDYYDKTGKPIELMEWATLLENPDYKIIKQEIVGEYWVSTVWLGLNHNYGAGDPLIFETMVFSRERTEEVEIAGKKRTFRKEYDCERYPTLEEAVAGHDRLVAEYKNK